MKKFQFGKKSCDAYSVDNINYVVVNSMYHMNRKHGEVDLDAFREVVCKIEKRINRCLYASPSNSNRRIFVFNECV